MGEAKFQNRRFPGRQNRSPAATVSRRRIPAIRRKKSRRIQWLLKVFLILIVCGLAYWQVRSWVLKPQAILVLGGSPDREAYAAEFAQAHPDLPIWVSSGSPEEYSTWLFTEEYGIDLERLHLDYRAVDTVTNFTSLVDEFDMQNIHSLYLVTSDYHMRRAQVIGTIVFGSRGIEFQPLPVPTEKPSEPWNKVARDAARSLLWVATGHTGASLGHRYRAGQLQAPKIHK
ncbi:MULTISPECIES: YdcF family protein [unclassified Leptolyngbya]|uniref:YdcF family protein n=1 Tax=unclassified Leptolyngbya TaxID=2650499 RepID=UPI00168505DB|nr:MULTISPECIES: YdcF family protein [unclassified Leptolyngbya]MBD1909508.1 YdcF family protein [Leptolyngbya sp. FACHB-8]MBD2159007.1 YdcF family protein [Leptolyngbya sp. FACHB-16]